MMDDIINGYSISFETFYLIIQEIADGHIKWIRDSDHDAYFRVSAERITKEQWETENEGGKL